eukprot:830869-Pleurochrysis_carterae.AAC.2
MRSPQWAAWSACAFRAAQSKATSLTSVAYAVVCAAPPGKSRSAASASTAEPHPKSSIVVRSPATSKQQVKLPLHSRQGTACIWLHLLRRSNALKEYMQHSIEETFQKQLREVAPLLRHTCILAAHTAREVARSLCCEHAQQHPCRVVQPALDCEQKGVAVGQEDRLLTRRRRLLVHRRHPQGMIKERGEGGLPERQDVFPALDLAKPS